MLLTVVQNSSSKALQYGTVILNNHISNQDLLILNTLSLNLKAFALTTYLNINMFWEIFYEK